jgi:tetratricopeptide (TPR) repeat protein
MLGLAVALVLLVGGWWDSYRLRKALARAQQNQEQAERNVQVAFAVIDRLLDQVTEDRRGRAELSASRKQLLAAAASACEAVLGPIDDAEPARLREIGQARWRLGQIALLLDQQRDALEHYSQARFILARLVGASNQPADRDVLARLCLDQGGLFAWLGRKGEAETALRQTIAMWEESPPTTAAQQANLAGAYLMLARLLQETDHGPDAERLLRKAVEVHDDLVRAHPRVLEYRTALAEDLTTLARLLVALHRGKEAQEMIERSTEVLEELQRLSRQKP